MSFYRQLFSIGELRRKSNFIFCYFLVILKPLERITFKIRFFCSLIEDRRRKHPKITVEFSSDAHSGRSKRPNPPDSINDVELVLSSKYLFLMLLKALYYKLLKPLLVFTVQKLVKNRFFLTIL